MSGAGTERPGRPYNTSVSADEPQRLRIIEELGILDTEPEAEFEALTRLACVLTGYPIACVSIITADRQWFKSAAGLPFAETPTSSALCAYAITQDAPLLVPDTLADARFASHPAVIGPLQIRAHAAVPIEVEGCNIGTVAAASRTAGVLAPHVVNALCDLAVLAGQLLETRLRARRLRLKEARVRAAERASSEWLWETDANAKLTWISESLIERLGDAARGLIGRDWSSFIKITETQDAEWRRFMLAHDKRQQFFEVVLRMVIGDRTIAAAFSGFPVLDSAGRFRGYRGAARDVSREHQLRAEAQGAAQALALAEERWKFALAGGGQGAWDWDIGGSLIHVSSAWCEITGTSETSFVDIRIWTQVVHPDDRERVRDRTIALFRGQTSSYEQEFRVRRGDGTDIWVLNRGKVIHRDASGRALRVVGTLSDITERRQAEALQRDKQAAELASRSKTRFLSRMSHEMRTPLNAVIGFAQLLTDPHVSRDHERVAEYASHVLSGGKHLLDLVDDVLDLQRAEENRLDLKIGPVSVEELVASVFDEMRPLAQACAVRLVNAVDGQAIVLADRARLQQVLTNLASNGVKFNRPSGTVRLSIETTANHDTLRIVVEDSGAGITTAQLERLFEPFERLGRETSSVDGTGLGLIVARALTESMGGHLIMSSRVDKGTRAMVELPRAATPPVSTRATPAQKQRPAARLLYVEDNRVNALLFGEAMRTLGNFDLKVAEDGTEALELVRGWQPDVLVLDAHLPGMTGYEVLDLLRQQPGLEAVPAFMCSADALPEDLAKARAAGFHGYWTKPIDFEKVINDLDKLPPTFLS